MHHLTYERLGCERDADLEVLCSTCHRGEHLENPDQTSLGIYLKLASTAVKAEPFGSIADLAEAVRLACAALKIPPSPGRINSALAVVCGNRLKTAPTVIIERKAEPPAVSKAEAFAILCRLRTSLEKPLTIRQISASTPSSVIDIYAPVPQPDWGDHDRY